MKKFDMHCHTTISDGTSTPTALIDKAKEGNFDFLCITDHDALSTPYITQIQEAGIMTIPSVEISAVNSYDNRKSLHITYYAKGISQKLEQILANTRTQKTKLIDLQLERLKSLGFFVDTEVFYDELLSIWRQKWGIAKYDIARYIIKQPQNKDLLEKLGCTQAKKTHKDFYERALKRRGDLYEMCGVEVEEYEPEIETLGLVAKEENAILSIAHPNFSFSREGIHGFIDRVHQYKELWINAIEINTRATRKWVEAILSIKEQFWPDFFLTFGSDCHQIGKPDDKHGDLGFENVFIPNDMVEREIERFQEKLLIY